MAAEDPNQRRRDLLTTSTLRNAGKQPLIVSTLIRFGIPPRAAEEDHPAVRATVSAFANDFLRVDIISHGKYVESHLEKGIERFVGGSELTSADFVIAFSLELFAMITPEVVRPKMSTSLFWPAYRRGLKRAGTGGQIILPPFESLSE